MILICQARADRLSSTYREKEQDVGEEQKKSGLRKNKLKGDVKPAKIC